MWTQGNCPSLPIPKRTLIHKYYFIFYILSMFYWLYDYNWDFFSPFHFPLSFTLPPTSISPTLSSCPWVVHISYLVSPFPILFLISPCLFCTYHMLNIFGFVDFKISVSMTQSTIVMWKQLWEICKWTMLCFIETLFIRKECGSRLDPLALVKPLA